MGDVTACEWCGETFASRGRGATTKRFCSERCCSRAGKVRDAAALTVVVCEGCGVTADIAGRPNHWRRFCSERCRQLRRCNGCGVTGFERPGSWATICPSCKAARRLPRSERACTICGRTFTITGKQLKKVCSNPCYRAYMKAWHQENADRYRNAWRDPDKKRARDMFRRARKKGAPIEETVSRETLGERDKWRCALCGKKVNPRRSWPDPLSASVDHIVPLTAGGQHSMANTQIAHLVCNTRKGNRPADDQLRLIG